MAARQVERRQTRQERRSAAWRVLLYLLLLGAVVTCMLRLRPARRPSGPPAAALRPRGPAVRGEQGSAAAATSSTAPGTMPATAGNALGRGPTRR